MSAIRISKRMREVEAKFGGKPIDQVLLTMSYDEGLSQAEISEATGVPMGTLGGWMIRLGISRRQMADKAHAVLRAVSA